MVGSALVRILKTHNVELITKEKKELDLLSQNDVKDFFKYQKIDQVYLAAAKVGGIHANNAYPAEFIYENLMIQTNVIHGAFLGRVKKLLFLGSSCIYPKNANQPMKEEDLLTGKLEPTNEPYGISKIAGIKMCESYNRQYGASHSIDYRSIMPTNLYGPGDNYDLETSHVLPALLRKFHEAKLNGAPEVVLWGTGSPLREFMHCDDLADALIFLLKNYSSNQHINIGSGFEISILSLAKLIAEVVGYDAKLTFDNNKPDGTPRKLMDSSRLQKLGWNGARSLRDGLSSTYQKWLNENK